MIRQLILFSSLLSILACSQKDDDGQIACTTEFVYGLSITVTDGITGNFVVNNISVTASDGGYFEELMSIEQFENFFGAGERPGTYIIQIVAEGYEEFTSEPIQVGANECHVIPEVRTFEIQPN